MTTVQRQVYTDTVLLRIYLEGVLFPYAKSVTVTESEGTVSAQIEVPPSVKLKPDELAGMTCHIFYANKRVLQTVAADPGDNEEPIGAGWPILFQGELAGESVSTTVQSENVVLTFTSHARHFEQTLLYFYDPARQENVLDIYRQATFIGNTEIQMENSGTVLDKKTQILTTLTRKIGELEQDEDRNITFTAMALELLRSTGEQHAIFNYFDEKFKLTQRFAAYADPDVKKILELTQLKHLIENRSQGLPTFASVMQLLDIPTSIMKYNWNQLAQPRLRPERLPDTIRRTNANDISKRLRKAARQFGVDVYNGKRRVSTVLGFVEVPADYLNALKLGGTSSASFIGQVDVATFINDTYLEFSELLEEQTDQSEDKLLLLAFQRQVDQYKLPWFGQIKEKKKKEEDADSLESVEDEAVDTVVAEFDEEQSEDSQKTLDIDQAALRERDELNEFTITPNMQFGQPPKCNVLFPASFTTYGITRNHLQEPTRLYGRVDIVPAGRDAKNTAIEWYIAPLSQAYHHLDGTNLARFSPAYEKFLEDIPNRIAKPPESTDDISGFEGGFSSTDDVSTGGFSSEISPNDSDETIAKATGITIQEVKDYRAAGILEHFLAGSR